MKVLQIVKYYKPSKGGMESVVENIVEGVKANSNNNVEFTIYSNSHIATVKRKVDIFDSVRSIKEYTPFLFKSQPLSIIYPSLRELILDADVIHHHYPFPNMELALLRYMDLLKSKKLIITWHANIKNSRWSGIAKYYNPVIKRLLDIADHIIVTSPQLLDNSDVLPDYVSKVIVIPLSFAPSIMTDEISYKRFPNERKFKLLFVGKLRAYKGVEYLLNAIKDLDIELTIVGEGEKEIELKAIVVALSIQNKVTFLKGISNQSLANIYASSDIFVLPSINEAEAFGVVQLEAMTNGLPVINTSILSGVPYVSLDGISGLTVEPMNADALKDAIVRITSDSNLFETFSKGALDRSKEFTREKMAEAYNKLYKNV